eukprot:m.142647 g.142647  ORF g.142647 m.142647 type:complete len:168 (+) comp11590_c3_seq1:1493-1996(+)
MKKTNTGNTARAKKARPAARTTDTQPPSASSSSSTTTPPPTTTTSTTSTCLTTTTPAIVSAGPMAPAWHGPDTRPTWWEAVWFNRVNTIVALCPPARGLQGCAAYAITGQYGHVYVTVEAETPVLKGLALERRIRLCWSTYVLVRTIMPYRLVHIPTIVLLVVVVVG